MRLHSAAVCTSGPGITIYSFTHLGGERHWTSCESKESSLRTQPRPHGTVTLVRARTQTTRSVTNVSKHQTPNQGCYYHNIDDVTYR